MGGIARRLDRDPREIEAARQLPIRRQIIQRGHHETAEISKDVCHSLQLEERHFCHSGARVHP